MRSIWVCAAVLALLVGTAGMANAAPLNLTPSYPDLAVFNVDTMYDAGSGQFTATGDVTQFTLADGLTSYTVVDTTMSIDAQVDNNGNLLSGTLTVQGVIPGLDLAPDMLLLSADLTAFGFSGSGASTVFEFLGDPDGGALASYFVPDIGVVLDPGATTYNEVPSFTVSFVGEQGRTDILVPEPATMLLVAGGLLAAPLRRKRRR